MTTRDQTSRFVAATAVGALCVITLTVFAQSPKIDVKKSDRPILDAARQYVSTYQEQLAFVLAEEAAVQRVRNAAGVVTQTRVTRSEVFFVFVPGDKEWLAVRQVQESDGQPVANQKDVRALLSAGKAVNVSGQLKQTNAQFNIGRISRNFNEPTLGLLVLDERYLPQFAFKRTTSEIADGVDLTTFSFKETRGPTLIRTTGAEDVFATGTLVIEQPSGRVRETHLEFKAGSLRASQTTTYVREPKLEIQVPKTFTERYEQTAKGTQEVVECEAVYSNFRRFEVTGRIR